MSSSESYCVSNAVRPCEAILYPVILIVSAVLYSKIIDIITDEEMKASAAVVLCGAILCILRRGNAQKRRRPYKDDYNKDNHK